MNFLFTCGGTAGHIYPAIAVAGRLRELMPDCGILFIGAENQMETDLVPREGFDIKTVRVTNLQRSFKPDKLLHNIKSAGNIIGSVRRSKQIIRDFKPDAAVGTGGYVCYPVLRAASGMGVGTAILESNATPGLTTRMLAKRADKILVGFEESAAYYKERDKIAVTGTPVRSEFTAWSREDARRELGIASDTPLILSVWGSLGAGFMNGMIAEFSNLAAERGFNLIHAIGKRDYAKVCGELGEGGLEGLQKRGIDLREYIYDMPKVMAAADLVMCRSGASTLSELAVAGKPAVLVPSPNVTNNHQEKNARVLESCGAAKVVIESEISSYALFGAVAGLLCDRETLESMSREMTKAGFSDSADRITGIVLGLAER